MARHIFGAVNADGTIQSGSGGFEIAHDDKGEYTIVYLQPFKSQPVVVVTQNYPSWDNFSSDGGSTKDNCVVVASNNAKVKIKTGGDSGSASDRNFNFISIGDE